MLAPEGGISIQIQIQPTWIGKCRRVSLSRSANPPTSRVWDAGGDPWADAGGDPSETTYSACLWDAISQAMWIETSPMERSEDTFLHHDMSTIDIHGRPSWQGLQRSSCVALHLKGEKVELTVAPGSAQVWGAPGVSVHCCSRVPGLPVLRPGPGTDSTICKIFAYLGNKCLKFAYEMTVIIHK